MAPDASRQSSGRAPGEMKNPALSPASTVRSSARTFGAASFRGGDEAYAAARSAMPSCRLFIVGGAARWLRQYGMTARNKMASTPSCLCAEMKYIGAAECAKSAKCQHHIIAGSLTMIYETGVDDIGVSPDRHFMSWPARKRGYATTMYIVLSSCPAILHRWAPAASPHAERIVRHA